MSLMTPATKDDVKSAACEFLRVVCADVEANLGPNPQRTQRSQWMVSTGPGGMSSKEFERETLDRRSVQLRYLNGLRSAGFHEQECLVGLLTEAGIQEKEILYGYLCPLVDHCLDNGEPLMSEKGKVESVLEEFASAVIDDRFSARSRHALSSLELTGGPVYLEDGVSIRPVVEEELWTFGNIDWYSTFRDPMKMPSEDWVILEICIERGRNRVPAPLDETCQAVAAGLRLASSGRFSIFPLGWEQRYGAGAMGRLVLDDTAPQWIGQGNQYVLDNEVADRLKRSWTSLRRLLSSQGYYLRLPAQRLVDAGSRNRPDEAIIDYSIGLEALLTKGPGELSYRFAVRGATILGWEGGDKKALFDKLRCFYEIRSSIVHGKTVDKSKLNSASLFGETALRNIWWWYFDQNEMSLECATSIVDRRILK